MASSLDGLISGYVLGAKLTSVGRWTSIPQGSGQTAGLRKTGLDR